MIEAKHVNKDSPIEPTGGFDSREFFSAATGLVTKEYLQVQKQTTSIKFFKKRYDTLFSFVGI